MEALQSEAAWKSYEPAQKKAVNAIHLTKSGDVDAFKSGDIQRLPAWSMRVSSPAGAEHVVAVVFGIRPTGPGRNTAALRNGLSFSIWHPTHGGWQFSRR